MPVLRLRTDSWRDAGKWRAILLHAAEDPRVPSNIKWAQGWPDWHDTHEEAKVGDVWRLRQRPFGPHVVLTETEHEATWWTIGYALVCPVEKCRDGVHSWTHAYNCPALGHWGVDCKRGAGRWSCWDWTGSVEAGDLTAAPSLHVLSEIERDGKTVKLDTCGFHGYLRAGVVA